jgi:hypothetical protein
MNSLKGFFTKLHHHLSGADMSSFKLLSLRPYIDIDEYGRMCVNMDKPFRYPVAIKKLDDVNVSKHVYGRGAIGCADDICMEAINCRENIEAVAHGIQITLSDAVMEASRYEGVETCKYIVFDHPLHSRSGKGFAYVLENTAAPTDATDVAVITLVPLPQLPLLLQQLM